jgi:hypothetical protein
VEFARALIAAYLIATLATTALAKLKNWRASSVSVIRESVIPPRAAGVAVVAVAAVELLLATLFMLGIESAVAGFAGMGLFLAFCGYQLLVAVKTNSLMCSCAGTSRTDPASLPAVAGATLACLVQATLACTLAVVGGRPSGNLDLLTITAWTAPIIVFLAGLLRRSGQPEMDERFHLGLASRRYEFEEITDGQVIS